MINTLIMINVLNVHGVNTGNVFRLRIDGWVMLPSRGG